jgi:hypothetical protein
MPRPERIAQRPVDIGPPTVRGTVIGLIMEAPGAPIYRSLGHHQSKCPRRSCSNTHRLSRHTQLLLRRSRGSHRHDHYTHHRDRNAPSTYQRAPPSHSTALTERTNQDSHDLRRHSPVLPRRQQRHIDPSYLSLSIHADLSASIILCCRYVLLSAL